MATIGELFQQFLEQNSGIRPPVETVETLYETLEKMEHRYAQNGVTGDVNAALGANLSHYIDANGAFGVPENVKGDVEELFVRSAVHRETLTDGEAKRLAVRLRNVVLPALEKSFIDTTAKRLSDGDTSVAVANSDDKNTIEVN